MYGLELAKEGEKMSEKYTLDQIIAHIETGDCTLMSEAIIRQILTQLAAAKRETAEACAAIVDGYVGCDQIAQIIRDRYVN